MSQIFLYLVGFFSDISPQQYYPLSSLTSVTTLSFCALIIISVVIYTQKIIFLKAIFFPAIVLFIINGVVCTKFEVNQLKVTFLNVGHGDSAILKFPEGKVMVIDAGGDPLGRFDTGRNTVLPALLSEGVSCIDCLLLTHPHPDHVNGAGFLIGKFCVRELWINHAFDHSEAGKAIIQSASSKGIKIIYAENITGSHEFAGSMIDVIHSSEKQSDIYSDICSGNPYADKSCNNASTVVNIRHGKHVFLFAGDIETEMEEAVLKRKSDLKACVLKVPHHGSRSSSSESFIDAVNPEYAVFSASTRGKIKLPAPGILKRYMERKITPLLTEHAGAITFESDGENLSVKTGKKNKELFAPYGAPTRIISNHQFVGGASAPNKAIANLMNNAGYSAFIGGGTGMSSLSDFFSSSSSSSCSIVTIFFLIAGSF
jgi:competence protein ComEC